MTRSRGTTWDWLTHVRWKRLLLSLAFVRDCLEGQGAHCTRSFPDEDETPFTESLDRAADLSERSGMLDDPGRRDWGRVRRRTERTSSLGCDDRRRAAALKFRPLSPVP